MKDFKKRVFYIIFTVFVVMGVSAQVALKRVPITPAYTVPKNYRNTGSEIQTRFYSENNSRIDYSKGRNVGKLKSKFGDKYEDLFKNDDKINLYGPPKRGLAVESLIDVETLSKPLKLTGNAKLVDASYVDYNPTTGTSITHGPDMIIFDEGTGRVHLVEIKSKFAQRDALNKKQVNGAYAQATKKYYENGLSRALKDNQITYEKLKIDFEDSTGKDRITIGKKMQNLSENIERLKKSLEAIKNGNYDNNVVKIVITEDHGLEIRLYDDLVEVGDDNRATIPDNLAPPNGEDFESYGKTIKTISHDEAKKIFTDMGFSDADADAILGTDSSGSTNSTTKTNTISRASKKSGLIVKLEKKGLSGEEMIEEIYREQEKSAKGSLITSRVISGIFIGLSTIMEIKSIIDFVNGEIPQSEFVFNTISNGLAITTGIVGMVFDGLSFAGKIGKMVPAVFGYITAAVFLVVDISKEIWAFCHGQITQTQLAIGIAASVFATGVSIGVGIGVSALLSNIGLFSAMGSAAGPVGTIVGAVVGVGVGIGAYFGVRAAGNAICNHFESLKEPAHFNKHCDTIKSYYGLAA